MSKPTTRRSPISYRPPKYLEAAFDDAVKLSGLSVNAFITEAWHGKSRHRPAERKFLARILARCATISDQLREEASSEPGGNAMLLEQIRNELIRIRTTLMRMLGRRS